MATGRFGYRRGIAPMLWVLVALSGIELTVVHLVLAHWWPRAALVVSLATLAGVGWLVAAILSFERLPVTVGEGEVVLRVGRLKRVVLPAGTIAGVRLGGWTAEEVKARATLNLALVAWPNVVVDLSAPRPGRRGIVAVAHRLDDPAGFAAAVERLQRGT